MTLTSENMAAVAAILVDWANQFDDRLLMMVARGQTVKGCAETYEADIAALRRIAAGLAWAAQVTGESETPA